MAADPSIQLRLKTAEAERRPLENKPKTIEDRCSFWLSFFSLFRNADGRELSGVAR
jgi:hypothetical protein